MIFRRDPTAENILNTFTQVASYLSADHISSEKDQIRLERVKRCLEPIDALVEQKWVKPHKAELQFRFTQTHQSANLYVYKNMLLIVSQVAHVNDLDESQFGADGNRLERIKNWCLDQNKQLSLGFLHVNGDGELNFCERLFIDNLPETDLQSILRAIVVRADMYEAFLTGRDVC